MDVCISKEPAGLAALSCSLCDRGFFKTSVGGGARTIYVDIYWTVERGRRRSSANKNSVLRKDYQREDQYLSIKINYVYVDADIHMDVDMAICR